MVEVPPKVLKGPAKTGAIDKVKAEAHVEEETVHRVLHSKPYEVLIAYQKFWERIYKEIIF
jgi:hypothetical protein